MSLFPFGDRLPPRSALRPWMSLGAVLGLVVVLGGCRKAEPAAKSEAATKTEAAAKPEAVAPASAKPAAAVPEPVRKLLGKWLRSDGGYVLELKNPDLSGVIEAAYFNPKSIHVSRAIWMQGGGGFQVMVELNDVGYPGATYVLDYNPEADRLAGKYNQPAMQQSFDIEFVRQGPYKP